MGHHPPLRGVALIDQSKEGDQEVVQGRSSLDMTKQPVSQFPMFDALLGKERRDEVLDSFELTASGWLVMARGVAEDIALRKGRVTSDDVLESIGLPPSHIHPNVIGAMFNNKMFVRVDVTPSRRPRNNASIIGVWALKDDFTYPALG
jgi:hypothetical protein